MSRSQASVSRPIRPAHAVVVVAVLLAGLLAVPMVALPSAAWSHGDDETGEAYLLVLQAIGHLAHDTTHVGIDQAMEKVDDARKAEDQEGVDGAKLEEAMNALKAHQANRARALLQASIEQALRDQPPATGNETGTTVVVPKLSGRSGVGGQDWGFLVLSVAVLALGLWLAFRFRPIDTVGDLRRSLAHRGTGEEAQGEGIVAERPAGRSGRS